MLYFNKSFPRESLKLKIEFFVESMYIKMTNHKNV